jgi:hypothetical protein
LLDACPSVFLSVALVSSLWVELVAVHWVQGVFSSLMVLPSSAQVEVVPLLAQEEEGVVPSSVQEVVGALPLISS